MHDTPSSLVTDRTAAARIADRDGRVCCLTGLGDSFLGPRLLDWILSEQGFQRRNCDGGYWLVRRSAAAAFAQGYFQFGFNMRPKYSVVTIAIGGPRFPSIVTTTPGLRFVEFGQDDAPDLVALEILSLFAKPVRWAHVASEMEQRRSKKRRKSILPTFSPATGLLTKVAVTVWKLAPRPTGTWTYRHLGYSKVQRLRFGLYLKTTRFEWQSSVANESAFLLTSRVPGNRLGFCIDTLSDEELADLVCQLRHFVGYLRTIQRDAIAENTTSNAGGGTCYDFRITAAGDDDFVGPFANEDDFNNNLRCGALPGVVQRKRHRIVFTHGDLNMRNILVRNGKLSGVVDWENSGWYPEYWEYTKACHVTKFHRRWLAAVGRVFEHYGDYTEELEIERKLWEYCF
ncbi:hypothetical protein B0H66DRAFT_591386 [Apodospora peruviana]|uniref:Aminoglycoside phosphotransferase domain-containing protein n=1 Tax=Apodospora peruviana TaxID=516989 RepID=A0AAE0M4A5_9PEZI|nr:hypothetical protein B0H66DRAFT_591386 [Apodospora peruviana]